MQTKATKYFINVVLEKRPYLSFELCNRIIAEPLDMCVQEDGRKRFWGQHDWRFIRVVTLADGQTLHNAFYDRNFRTQSTTGDDK